MFPHLSEIRARYSTSDLSVVGVNNEHIRVGSSFLPTFPFPVASRLAKSPPSARLVPPAPLARRPSAPRPATRPTSPPSSLTRGKRAGSPTRRGSIMRICLNRSLTVGSAVSSVFFFFLLVPDPLALAFPHSAMFAFAFCFEPGLLQPSPAKPFPPPTSSSTASSSGSERLTRASSTTRSRRPSRRFVRKPPHPFVPLFPLPP